MSKLIQLPIDTEPGDLLVLDINGDDLLQIVRNGIVIWEKGEKQNG